MTEAIENIDVRVLERKNCREYWIHSAENHNRGARIIHSVFDFLKIHSLEPVSMRFFGSRKDIAEVSSCLETKEIGCPHLFILQDNSAEQDCLNVQIHALSKDRSEPLYCEDKLIGRAFEDDCVKYYMLNILPDERIQDPFSQTKNVFEKAHKILQSLGSGFPDTIRTWLFANDILSWYDHLNEARNQFFEYQNIYNQLVPASTGVGVPNPYGRAVAVQLLALRPKGKAVGAQSINSPLQCPALSYKSSFSRAVKIDLPDFARLYISGTASIDRDGKTVFLDDTPAQIDWTMRVIKAVLDQAAMDWSDVVTSIAYFKHRRDFSLFDDYCRKHSLKLPHIKVQADVCREDLLFEMELEAVKTA